MHYVLHPIHSSIVYVILDGYLPFDQFFYFNSILVVEYKWLQSIRNGLEQIQEVIKNMNETLVIYIITETEEIPVDELITLDKGVRIDSAKIPERRLTVSVVR